MQVLTDDCQVKLYGTKPFVTAIQWNDKSTLLINQIAKLALNVEWYTAKFNK